MPRLPLLALLALVACSSVADQSPAISNSPPDIATATFAPSLGIDIAGFSHNANGLYWKDLSQGDGPVVQSGQRVAVAYDGHLPDGTRFDQSAPGRPYETRIGVGAVIGGWDQGIPGMRVGGRRVLVIPPSLGYGAGGSPPVIPGSAVLVFTVEVVAVE
jgi:peptidylprolyl isomerase